MAQATRTRKASAKVEVTPDDVKALVADLDANVLIERGGVLKVIVHGFLSGTNVHLEGPAGTGKSQTFREFSLRIGGVYFEKALHGQMPVDAILGGYDMPRFAKEGVFERNPKGKLPMAHVPFIDEITRANGPTTDALLPIMNTEERLVEIDGQPVVAEILYMGSGANFMPPPDDPQLGAFVDRFTLMQHVNYVQSDEGFIDMLERHERRLQGGGSLAPQATITLEQAKAAQAQVNQIPLGQDFKLEATKLRSLARQAGLFVSDRRFIELGRVSRASAWLAGRPFAIPEDLAVWEHGLWREKDEIATAHSLCLDYVGQYEREADEVRQEAMKPLAAIEEFRAVVEATPPTTPLPDDLIPKTTSARRMVLGVREHATRVEEETEKAGADTTSIREVAKDLDGALAWFQAQKLDS